MIYLDNFFNIEKISLDCKARAGSLKTTHGIIETPVFMPVGTQGTVKAIDQRTLEELNTKLILGNTYHLYLRPGVNVIHKFGGLHKFINWDRAILTDSGGYQIFSLQELRVLSEEGVEFKSHIDGSKHFFSPEKVVEIQRYLGSDIIMQLDECIPYPCDFQAAKKSMELTLRWLARTKSCYIKSRPVYSHWQFLFSIGQGSMYPSLRKDCIEQQIALEPDGFAIGGLSVGEPTEMMYEIVNTSTDIIPQDKPRYLMGVGTPENILEAVERGVDMFDCVIPTRNARNAQLFTTRGKINIKNSMYKLSEEAIDEEIDSYASRNFSLGYLRHLFMSREILGIMLATQHNIAFYQWLMKTLREKILSDEFRQWKKIFLEKFLTI